MRFGEHGNLLQHIDLLLPQCTVERKTDQNVHSLFFTVLQSLVLNDSRFFFFEQLFQHWKLHMEQQLNE